MFRVSDGESTRWRVGGNIRENQKIQMKAYETTSKKDAFSVLALSVRAKELVPLKPQASMMRGGQCAHSLSLRDCDNNGLALQASLLVLFARTRRWRWWLFCPWRQIVHGHTKQTPFPSRGREVVLDSLQVSSHRCEGGRSGF